METLQLVVLILGIVAGTLVLLAAAGLVLARRWVLAAGYDEVHRAQTADGWSLALHRYRGEPGPGRPPVVLCHGVAANRHNLDLDGERSLARCLRARGRDVWLLELRGAGLSDRPDRKAGRLPGWNFDHHAAYDVPAALALVARETGCAEVDWVGFSMGGLVAYAYFGAYAGSQAGPGAEGPAGRTDGAAAGPRPGDAALPRLRRLVTIGSPVMTRPVRSLGMITAAGRLLGPFARTPLAGPARAFAFAVGPLQRVAGGQVCARGGSAPAALRLAMANVVADVSRGVSRQFGDWLAKGRFASWDGRIDYAAAMARIEAPTLVIGGAADRLAPPRTVRAAWERLGAADKRLVVLGPTEGHQGTYGHADLAFGHHAPTEVYPLVADWLEAAEPTAAAREPEAALGVAVAEDRTARGGVESE